MGPLKTFTIPQLFIDQDGVLADLDSHYLYHFGKTADHPGAFSPEEFWGAVNGIEGFWRTIPPFAGTIGFWEKLCALHPHPMILTSISASAPDDVEVQKREWVKEHLGSHVTLLTCRAKDKRLFCQSNDILVDDWIKHRKPWELAGGRFIHHQQNYDASVEAIAHELDISKRFADRHTVYLSYDGSMMCESHPGFELGLCPGGKTCIGPGTAWKLSGRTEIQHAMSLALNHLRQEPKP